MEQFQIVVGNRLRDISHAIQTHAVSHSYGAVRDFWAHGIRPSIHEEPNFPHYGLPGRGLCLEEGITITIEPMITTGTCKLRWTLTVGLHVPEMGATVLNMSILLRLQKMVLSL